MRFGCRARRVPVAAGSTGPAWLPGVIVPEGNLPACLPFPSECCSATSAGIGSDDVRIVEVASSNLVTSTKKVAGQAG